VSTAHFTCTRDIDGAFVAIAITHNTAAAISMRINKNVIGPASRVP